MGFSDVKTAPSNTKFDVTTLKKGLSEQANMSEVSDFTANLLSNVYRNSLMEYDKIVSKREKKGDIDHI